MPTVPQQTPDELDIKLALCAGFGLSVERMLEVCDINSPQTFYNRQRKWPEHFERWRSWSDRALIAAVDARVKKAEDTQKAESRITEVFARSLRLTEKLLDRAEREGDKASEKLLFRVHNDITKWAGTYAASTAPKRIQLTGEVHHTHEIADETFSRVAAFATKYERLLPEPEPAPALPPSPSPVFEVPQDAIEAEVVG
jgi:hypothetical protein